MFFMASALWVCSGPVISPLLGGLLGGDGTPSNYGYGSPVHALAFCVVFLALYVLAVVSRHFPDSRTVSLSLNLNLSLSRVLCCLRFLFGFACFLFL